MAVDHRLVTLTAIDGATHDALLVIDERAARARERASGRRTACFHVHGIMGNFLVGTLRFLAPAVARAGFPVLVIETRMGNVGQMNVGRSDMISPIWWPAGFGYGYACCVRLDYLEC